MEKKTLGKRINITRKDHGITAEQLAELCSINATYLRQIEGGSKIPSLPLFIQLCNTLETSPDYLLQDEVDSKQRRKIKELELLWEKATPSTQQLVIAMLEAALLNIED